MASYHAEYLPKRYRANYEANIIVGRTPKVAWRRLRALLDEFAIVGTKLLRCAAQPSTSWTWAHRPAPSHPRPGTMERFDETMLMAHDLVGLRLIPYRQNRPGMKNGYRKSINAVCPDMAACRSAVRRVAPRDHMMYDRYRGRLETKIRSLGPQFGRRVALYKAAVAAAQQAWRRAPRVQTYCRFQQERRPTGSHWRDLRCPYGAPLAEQAAEAASPSPTEAQAASPATIAVTGPTHEHDMAACAAAVSLRTFECPWQYLPNSSLTDALGCWRPSSGFR